MPYDSLEQIVGDESLGLDANDLSAAGVRRAIDRRLSALQSEDATTTQATQIALLAARAFLDASKPQQSSPGGQELVSVPSATLMRLLAGSTEGVSGADRVERAAGKIRELKVVAVAKATRDFRLSRTVPAISITGFLAVVFAVEQSSGVIIRPVLVDPAVYAQWILVAIAATLGWFFLSSIAQRTDEAVLGRLYDPDLQSDALGAVGAWAQFRDPYDDGEDASGVGQAEGGWTFRRSEYRLHLLLACGGRPKLVHESGRRFSLVDRRYPSGRQVAAWSAWGSAARRGMIGLLSRVDLAGALADAADAALDRFVVLGVVAARWESGAEVFRTVGE